MTIIAVVLLAALNASGLMRSPNQINQRDGINLEKLSRSELDGLPEEERARRTAEHARVGRDLEGLLGFSFGRKLVEYGFESAEGRLENPDFPVFRLPKPVLGFERFRPLLVTERLCGVLLSRPLLPCEDEEERQAAFAVADFTVLTNLAAEVGLTTNDLSRATNGVPHVWNISFEHWRETQVLRIGDGELACGFVRALKAEAEAEERARVKKLMHAEEPAK